jgi:hypothetical protein
MSGLAVELWSRLPCALVERILSFLSVPALFKSGIVCKSWNSLICSPEFGASCAEHARQEAQFIVVREKKGWSLLDLGARRWYSVQRDEEAVFGSSITVGALAMDGGLVCQFLCGPRSRSAAVVVTNPIAKTSTRLPLCTAIAGSNRPVVDMVVDTIAHSYKVFLIPNGATEPLMVIYESATNQWRNSTARRTPPIGFPFRATCSVFLDGFLYVLVSPSTRLVTQYDFLWRYNHVEDTWNNTRVNLRHLESFHCPQLIVSDDRLFLASWVQKPPDVSDARLSYETWPWANDSWWYEISEVDLGGRACSKVFEMSEAGLREVLEVPKAVNRKFSPDQLRAFGCCRSIVLLCMSTGMSIVYDLSTSLWETLPVKPLRKSKNRTLPAHQPWECIEVGKPMNLFLPTVRPAT